jgi:Spy/CpxP family protein refolding chaperone
MKLRMLGYSMVVLLAAAAFAQSAAMAGPGQGPGPGMDQGPHMRHPGPEGPMDHDGMHARMPGPGGMEDHMAHMGKWWKNSELMQRIGLTEQQSQQIEKAFQDHRLQLIDLHAALEKQEVQLEPLMEADRPDEAQVIAQIDRVAQARAALEKSNAQMLLAIRRVLTVDQWKKLHSDHHMPGMMPTPAPPPPGGDID